MTRLGGGLELGASLELGIWDLELLRGGSAALRARTRVKARGRRIALHRPLGHPLDGEAGDLAGILQIEFFLDVGSVRLNRFHTHIQTSGDFFGALAFGNELQRLALARRQHVKGTGISG